MAHFGTRDAALDHFEETGADYLARAREAAPGHRQHLGHVHKLTMCATCARRLPTYHQK